MRKAAWAIAFAFVCGAAGFARAGEAEADPMIAFDDVILRMFAIQKCHASQDMDDRAVIARVDAVTKTAVASLSAEFDRISPAQHAKNETLAKSTIERRIAAHEIFIQSQVTEYGCDWLDGRVFPAEK